MEMSQESVNETVRSLDQQCGKLKEIQQRYFSQYNAAFDYNGAIESTKRWFDRTAKIIADRVSAAEAAKFRVLLAPTSTIRGSWEFDEWLVRFHTFINALLDDIVGHPDDPAYDRLLHAQDPQPEHASATKNDEPKSYDVFLSYQSLDKDEARAIFDGIEQRRKKCFLAEKSLKPGDTFTEEIRNAIKSAKEVWLLMSPNSLKSEWVKREHSAAWALEKRIVPILLRCSQDQLPDLLSQIHAIDYHNIASLISKLGSAPRGRRR
jgi:hypothetical protein